MFNNTPYIGQTLDYHPSPSERLAAICIEVHPTDDSFSNRPKVNLFVLFPNGNVDSKLSVSPVSNNDTGDDGFNPLLENRWSFQQEFAILQKDISDSPLGTNSNEHVGTVGNHI